MNKRIIIMLMSVLCFTLSTAFATSITFTFANGQITGSSPQFYEFDVMAQAGSSGTRIGDTQIYINYNTSAFGTFIDGNNKISVSKGSLLQGDTGEPFNLPLYNIINVTDNASSRVSITLDYEFDGSAAGNALDTSPTQLIHVKIEINDPMETKGLSFQQSLMDGQQYEDVYDIDTNPTAVYSPVNADDTDDSTLPVELTVFAAEPVNEKVVINWETESEINNLGFELYRAENEYSEYILLTDYKINPELSGQGNSNNKHTYSFTDETAKPETTYWYKLADLDYNGLKTFHGPISITTPKAIPKDFKLHSNYPNPFNPSTTIRFDIPATGNLVDTKLIIYNSLGQVVKNLFRKKLNSGSYDVIWNGVTDSGLNAPNGIYFVVFKADGFSSTGRLVLLK